MVSTPADVQELADSLTESEGDEIKAALTGVLAVAVKLTEHHEMSRAAFAEIRGSLDEANTRLRDLTTRIRTVEDDLSEVKGLLIGVLDR